MQYRYGAGGVGSFLRLAAWLAFELVGTLTSSTGSTSSCGGASGSILRNFNIFFSHLFSTFYLLYFFIIIFCG
jgi:hypothetical protein